MRGLASRPIVRRLVSLTVGLFPLMLASPGAWATVVPQTGVFNGSIGGATFVTIPGLTVNVASTLTAGSATGDTGTGFAGVTDHTSAGYAINQGYTLDSAATEASQTATDINFYYNYPFAGNASVFNGGLAGLAATSTTIVGHSSVSGGVPQEANVSGTITLVNPGPDTGSAALTFFNDVNTLTNGTNQLSFQGTASPTTGQFAISFLPILQSVSVLSGSGPQTANLLGGTGVAGGVQVMLNPGSPGALSAGFQRTTSGLSSTQLAALGVNFSVQLNIGNAPPQIWILTYTQGAAPGDPGSPISLTFTYDPSGFGPLFDPNTLEVAHFKSDGSVEILKTTNIDPINDTITVSDTSGFTPFLLVAPVPEPSTALLLTAGIAGLAATRRKQA